MKRADPEMIDVDNPELTEDDFARARPATEVLPELFGQAVADEFLKPRGRPRLANPKVHINIRIDADVLAHWKRTGRGWQTRMAAALKRTMPR